MTRARASLVSVADTPYYHCIGRCVRRAYLCGEDILTGRSFSHRRQWLLDRLRLLTETFAIELCAYALMSNHYHLVVKLEVERSQTWSAEDVVRRWSRLFGGSSWIRRYLAGERLTEAEEAQWADAVPRWRERLTNLSWFMRCLNEWMARKANQEDGCTGRFWEGRFKCQALLDESALLTAMAYVDLNPIRAGLADTLIDAEFTSIQQRLGAGAKAGSAVASNGLPALLPMADFLRGANTATVPFRWLDYVALVERTGRLVRIDKQGTLMTESLPILSTLGLAPDEWVKTVTQRQTKFELFIGSVRRLRELADARGWRWVRGIGASRRLYRRANE